MHPWPLHTRLMFCLLIPVAVFIAGFQIVGILQQQSTYADNEQLRHNLALATLSAHLEKEALTPEVIAPILGDVAINGLAVLDDSGQIMLALGQRITSANMMATLPQQILSDGRRVVLLPSPNSQRDRLIVQMAQALFLFITFLVVLVFILQFQLKRSWRPFAGMAHALAEHGRFIDDENLHKAHELWPQFTDQLSQFCEDTQTELNSLRSHCDQLEEELANTIETMERQQITLHSARQEAVTNNQQKSAFLANISHEIRTPLNSLIGFTRLLGRTKLNPEQLSHVQSLSRAAEHLLAMLNDLLDLSKIEAGRLVLDETPVNLRELVTDTIDMMQPLILDKPVSISHLVDALVPASILGDSLRLRQILSNLLSNAVKFTPSGDINVSLTTAATKTAGVVELVLAVKDSGIGIPSAQMPSLFDAFEQGDTSTTRRYGGTGLGLTITKQLVDLLQGQIDVESTVGQGSCFKVRWQAAIDPFQAIAKTAPLGQRVQAALNPPLRVLVVDDHPANLLLMRTWLNDYGIAVECAESGHDAVHLALQKPFDLVFMDIQMPGMNGVEAAQAIRAGEKYGQRVPIVALTAHAMKAGYQNEQNGIDDYLSKPLQDAQLLHILQQWTRFIAAPQALVDWQEGRKLANGKPELAEMLLRTLVDDLPATRQRLQTAYDQKTIAVWQQEIHRLLGACRYCGVPALRAQLEQAMTDNSFSQVNQVLSEIDSLLRWAQQWSNHAGINAEPSE
ncbi:MAG: ATP-binding protein [Moraxellaceae bacterium]|nr:ATP-binding protein [Moraxellaceae bacterium]MDZ4387905.1 ATP-binding protein [Moraxellaceae bacterium]